MYHHKQRGMSLIELMISLLLSSLLIIVAIGLLFAVKRSHHYAMALATLQQRGRIASHVLTQTIMQAGYVGCGNLATGLPIHTSQASGATTINNTNAISGTDDTVTVAMMASTKTVPLLQPVKHNRQLLVGQGQIIKAKDILLVSDCAKGDIIKIDAVQKHKQPKSLSLTAYAPLTDEFDTDAMVGPLRIIKFYVADTGRVNGRGQPILALYEKDQLGRRQEIVTGVNAMTIRYGVKFLTAEQVNSAQAWSKVTVVFITLHLQGSDGVDKVWPIAIALKERT